MHSASSCIPGFPGAQKILVINGESDNAQHNACSRAPFPSTSIFLRFFNLGRKLCSNPIISVL